MLKKLMHSRNNAIQHESANTVTEPVQPAVNSQMSQALPAANAESPAATPAPHNESNKLIVGSNIKLKGSEITDCETLVVEGRVEASMNSHHIRIAQGGVFCGKAEVDVAEIRGHFEGELIARKRLVIYATGKVTGQIQYGSMTVEEGGVISGSMEALSPAISPVKMPAPETATLLRPVHNKVTRVGTGYPATLLSRHMASKHQG